MEKNNTQKGIVQFAMEAGAYMGLYFVVKFIFAVLSLNYPFCNIVSTIMLLFVPLVVFFMMRKFSNQNEGGSYFSQLWMMGILLFFFASLISGLAQYIYYVYINPEYIKSQLSAAVTLLESLNMTSDPSLLEAVKTGLEQGNFLFGLSQVKQRNRNMDISVIVPLYNEAESLPELTAWIERVMEENKFSYEIWFINDGSTDDSWQVIESLREKNSRVKGVKFRRNYGKSPALYTGFQRAEGDVVITMDADLQDSPDEIPELYRMIAVEGYDLVSGWKKKRYDPLSKTIPTKLFNATARKVSGIKNLHDFNCGLKAYKKEVIKNIEVYGDMHRYIPYLAKNAGYNKIGEKAVHHQARKYGKTKFGLDRFVNGYLDLITLWFFSRFGVKPMHFFGLLGSLMFFLGLISVIVVGVNKLYCLYNGLPYRLVTDSPYFYLALTAMILGTQLFLAGFLGELISRNSSERNNYQIETEFK